MILEPPPICPIRDRWRTPAWLVAACELAVGVRVIVDVAAEQDAHVTTPWFGPASPWLGDALAVPGSDWAGRVEPAPNANAVAWCNPPYSRLAHEPWAERIVECAVAGLPVLAWVPCSIPTKWHHTLMAHASAIIAPRGRVQFIPPPGIDASSPRADTHGVLVTHEGGRGIVRRHCIGPGGVDGRASAA